MPTWEDFVWMAVAGVVGVAIVARTPFWSYVDGSKKILGVI